MDLVVRSQYEEASRLESYHQMSCRNEMFPKLIAYKWRALGENAMGAFIIWQDLEQPCSHEPSNHRDW